MSQALDLHLQFDAGIDPVTRARIEYAFRTFCAVYGRTPVLRDPGAVAPAQRSIVYGTTTPARYVARSPKEPAPEPAQVALDAHPLYTRLALWRVPVFHGAGPTVDWLGEIFEWLSSADDYAVTQRDDVGRVPFAASIHGRYQLDPTIPYASIAMFELARTLGIEPPASVSASIAASHDLDYLPTSLLGDVKRLMQNLGVAALVDRDPRLVVGILGSVLGGIVRRRSPLNFIDEMIERERVHGIRSTSNVICRRTCARDGNYTLDHPRVARALRKLHDSSGELGVHASYMSLRDGGFGDEVRLLRSLGFNVDGVRAHWLRYAGDDLFEAIADAGLTYDSTVGFSSRVGFRAGATFAYHPYRFASETPYPFYEIPLAIMDGALYTHARERGIAARALCERVLDMVDAFPCGGVSVLWHNTVFEGAQLPHGIGAMYWDLPRRSQQWTTSSGVVDARRHSFERAFAQ